MTSGVGLCSEESKDAALIARESERPRWAVVDQDLASKRNASGTFEGAIEVRSRGETQGLRKFI